MFICITSPRRGDISAGRSSKTFAVTLLVTMDSCTSVAHWRDFREEIQVWMGFPIYSGTDVYRNPNMLRAAQV